MVQPPRPRHRTPSSTFTNPYDQDADREYFADLDRRLRTLGFDPTDEELVLAHECVEILRLEKDERKTSVFDVLQGRIGDFDRQIKLTRVILTFCYSEGVQLGRKEGR